MPFVAKDTGGFIGTAEFGRDAPLQMTQARRTATKLPYRMPAKEDARKDAVWFRFYDTI